MKPNSSDFTFLLTYIIIFLILVSIIIIAFIHKAKNKIIAKELQKKNLEIQFQKDIIEKTILTQERERFRISQDLHDDISSKLIAISLNLHALKSESSSNAEKLDIIDNIIEINKKVLESSRNLSYQLYPPTLEKFGLKEALDELVLKFNKAISNLIELDVQVEFKGLTKNKKLQIYRVVQELVNNSLKHGKASKIKISFYLLNSYIYCKYYENGVGFEKNKLMNSKGLGFSNIDNRIRNLKGEYFCHTEVGKGFQFTFWFKDGK